MTSIRCYRTRARPGPEHDHATWSWCGPTHRKIFRSCSGPETPGWLDVRSSTCTTQISISCGRIHLILRLMCTRSPDSNTPNSNTHNSNTPNSNTQLEHTQKRTHPIRTQPNRTHTVRTHMIRTHPIRTHTIRTISIRTHLTGTCEIRPPHPKKLLSQICMDTKMLSTEPEQNLSLTLLCCCEAPIRQARPDAKASSTTIAWQRTIPLSALSFDVASSMLS